MTAESSVTVVSVLILTTLLLSTTTIPVLCVGNQDYVSLREVSPSTDAHLSIGTGVTLVVVVDYHLFNESMGTIFLEVLDEKNVSIITPSNVEVAQGKGTIYFRENIELPDISGLTIFIYLMPKNSEVPSATTSIRYEVTGFYLSNWYVYSAVVELALIAILLSFYYLVLRKKQFRPPFHVTGQNKGKLLLEFFTLITGLLGAFIFFLIWEKLIIKNWSSVTLLTFIFLLLFDDWYGSYRRYSELPYYLGHFVLDIIENFTFLLMAYAIVSETTLVVATIYIYALHGILWDIYYASRIKNSSKRKDLETSLHYASLLAATFAFLQLYFGWYHMFTTSWISTICILLGWVICRVFLLYRQKQSFPFAKHIKNEEK